MPWKPNTPVVQNASVDGFRETAAVMLQDSTPTTYLIFEVHAHWEILSGHLWWRRWSKGTEKVYGFEFPTDDNSEFFDDWVVDPDVSRRFLEDLLNGRYAIRDGDSNESTPPIVQEYEVVWLEVAEALKVRENNGFTD